MQTKPVYSVVVPVYNSDRSVVELYERLSTVFTQQLKTTFEMILVEDCSPNPLSWQTCKQLAENHDNVTAVRLSRNFRKPSAMMCGFEYVQGEYVISMDDDLQHPPEEIPKLITEQQHDLVLGVFQERKHNLMKRVLSKMNNWFEQYAIGKPTHIRYSPFQLAKRHIIEKLKTIKSPYPYIMGYLFYFTRDIAVVSVKHEKRVYGESFYTFGKLVNLFSITLINNSNTLLSILGIKGIGILITGVVLAAMQLFNYLSYQPVNNTALIISFVCMIGGLILAGFGVLGIYIIRMIATMEHRPPFAVSEVVVSSSHTS